MTARDYPREVIAHAETEASTVRCERLVGGDFRPQNLGQGGVGMPSTPARPRISPTSRIVYHADGSKSVFQRIRDALSGRG